MLKRKGTEGALQNAAYLIILERLCFDIILDIVFIIRNLIS